MEADERTVRNVKSAGRTCLAIGLCLAIGMAVLTPAYLSSLPTEAEGDGEGAFEILVQTVPAFLLGLGFLGVGWGLSRRQDWGRMGMLYSCLALAALIVLWCVFNARQMLLSNFRSGAMLAVIYVLFTTPLTIPLYSFIRWLRSPGVVAACLPPEVQAEPTEVLDEEE